MVEGKTNVVEHRCAHCGSTNQAHIQSNWCLPYENWLILGRLEFLVPILSKPDKFLQSPPPADPSLMARELGKKACVILLAAWTTELALKTLLVTDGHSIERGDAWGHDLRRLYDELSDDTKQELQDIHKGLGDPYGIWRDGKGVEDIVGPESNTFVVWRYLSGQSEITSSPKKLVTVARAAYSLNVRRTELPTWPEV